MFSSPTTLILGAGASVDFGAPLGEPLWRRISQQTGALSGACDASGHGTGQLLRNTRYDDPKAYAYYSEVFSLHDDPATLAAIMGHAMGAQHVQHSNEILRRIAERTGGADVHTSVDDFLRDNPSLLRPIRTLIAGLLFESLYERDSENHQQWNLRQQLTRFKFNGPSDGREIDNWVRLFVGICRPMLNRVTQETLVPVTVISFNYDRVMETVLSHFWAQSERPYPALDLCFKFIHPYGAFGELPWSVTDAGEWIKAQATGIGLADGKGSQEAKNIEAALSEAKQIFSLGFSFTDTNTQLLGLTNKHGPRLFVQNFGKDQRVARTLTKLNATATESGSIPQLVRNGFFEQQGA